MDKLFLWIMLPIWWLIIVTPDVGAVLEYIFRNTNPLANILWLALILIAARFSELQRLGKLPLFGRAETTEYAVEFDDEITGVWDDNDA